MNEKYFFSIGIPAYKDTFLVECITSILTQTYRNFELIIINDCSPHSIDQIVSQFNDYRLHYYTNEINVGAEHVVDNWNNCLSKASGDFFILMGDDDVMEPDYLEEFSKLIEKHQDLDVFHCKVQIINEQSTTLTFTPSWPEKESVYENIWHRTRNLRVQFISDFVYRTSTLKANGGYYKAPLAWASDDISSYIACGEKGIAHTNKPVFKYRTNRYTITSTGNIELKMRAIDQEHLWLSKFLSKKCSCSIDEIIRNSAVSNLKNFVRQKKVQTIIQYINLRDVTTIWKIVQNKNLYKVSMADIILALLKKYKQQKKASPINE